MTVESDECTDRDYEHSRERRQLRTELPQDFLLITKVESLADESRRQRLPFSEATCCLSCSVDPRKRTLSVGSRTIRLHGADFMVLQASEIFKGMLTTRVSTFRCTGG